METAKPNIPEARAFAEGVHAAVPHQKLAYNLSPSFNWDAAGMSKQEMGSFNRELGRLGFVWQVSYCMSGHCRRTGCFGWDLAGCGGVVAVVGCQAPPVQQRRCPFFGSESGVGRLVYVRTLQPFLVAYLMPTAVAYYLVVT